MSEPTVKAAIEWIARYDQAGDDTPDNPLAESHVGDYLTTALVADVFDVSPAYIAATVMAYRSKHPRKP
jgi:hypothetical protein